MQHDSTPLLQRLRRPRAPSDEAELVAAVLRGEPGAFRRLFNCYYRLVHGLTLARVPHCDVEDVVQDVFMTMALKLPMLHDPLRFTPWLCKLTRNYCIDHLRRRGRRMVQTLPPDMSKGPPRTAEAMNVLDAIHNLSEDDREILILRFVEGYTGPEIAKHLGMTHGSARIKLCRALRRLRKRLGEEDNQ